MIFGVVISALYIGFWMSGISSNVDIRTRPGSGISFCTIGEDDNNNWFLGNFRFCGGEYKGLCCFSWITGNSLAKFICDWFKWCIECHECALSKRAEFWFDSWWKSDVDFVFDAWYWWLEM